MNKPHLLQKLAPVGVAALSMIAATGITPAEAEAATAYAYSEANFDVDITTTGFTIPGFATETADSAEIRFPEIFDANADILDAEQACVNNGGAGPGACLVGENTFSGFIPNTFTDGSVGQNNADYARSDVLINSASTSGVEGINAAETFVDDVTGTQTIGDGTATWEYGTEQFTVVAGDSLTIDLAGYYDLIIELDGNQGFVEAEYEFGIFLDGIDLLDFAEDNNLVNSLSGGFEANPTVALNNAPPLPPGSFGFSEAISRTNLNGREVLNQQLDCDGAQSCSFTVNFGSGEGEIAPGNYNLTIESVEEVTARVQSVPEPASILGLLTVSGLGLALKRKKQS